MPEGYRYIIEEEKIREYRRLSAEEKLAWLDELNRFNAEALTPRARKVRARLRGDADGRGN